MLNKVKQTIEKYRLFESNHKILVGVSGGIDSVVLSHLLKSMGYEIGIAHVNFRLRAQDSELDEQFVCNWAKQLNVPYFVEYFDTQKYAHDNGLSIQVAARNLRYNWFEKTKIANNFHFVAIAHHLDDQIETFFINLIRGTGLDGINGIQIQRNEIVRPLLEIDRTEIEQYAKSFQLPHRDDASNESDKYLRNKIRHHIIPELKNISAGFNQTMLSNFEHFNESKTILNQQIKWLRQKTMIPLSEGYKIDFERIKSLNPLDAYLYEILKPYNFDKEIINQMITNMNGESGKQFFSSTHVAYKDRESWFIQSKEIRSTETCFFDENQTLIESPIQLNISKIKLPLDIDPSKNFAFIDFDKLKFPLLLRPWQAGDFFMPLGMNRMKKLSDFLIDNKIPLHQKKQVYVVVSDSDIVWVVGMRLDDRFKITDSTSEILCIEFKS